MLNQMIRISGLILILGLGLDDQAGDVLSDTEIKALVTGKTVYAEHINKGFEFLVYFEPDGKTALRKQNGEITETTYKIQGNRHCIYWKGKDRCATIMRNEDGSYVRVNDQGKQVVKWIKFEDGNKL